MLAVKGNDRVKDFCDRIYISFKNLLYLKLATQILQGLQPTVADRLISLD